MPPSAAPTAQVPVAGADDPVPRVAPVLDDTNRFFWTSGRDGVLRFMRCQACHTFLHPPTPVCRYCQSTDVAPDVVLGRGTVLSFTVNERPWTDQATRPYVIAIVGFDEQPSLHLTTNIMDCPPEDVVIGMPVEVRFVPLADSWIPLFRPTSSPPAHRAPVPAR